MFFTQEDYRKIYDWIKVHSIKDSEFNDSKPLDGMETITVVQQGHNVKFILQDFLEQLTLLNIPDFVNVTERYNLKYISLFEATKAIPYKSRKIGQVITFLDEDGNWKIYQFRGEKRNQWNILTLWVDILGEIIDKGSIIPDEEDLTAVKEGDKTVVKFKDKAYNPDNFSGKGRVYLRKNIVEVIDYNTKVKTTKNLLTQSMIGWEDTIYIVQYDYDLNGQTITISNKSILIFYGGHFNNGKLVCNNTYFTNIIKLSDIGTVTTSGTFVKGQILIIDDELSWFDGSEWIKFNSSTEIDTENLSDSFKNQLPHIDNIQLCSSANPSEITTPPESGDYLNIYTESFDTHTHNTYVPIKTINNESIIGEGNIDTIKSGVTLARPTNNIKEGFQYFDTILGKPIYWNGTKWVDAEGNDADSTPITSGTFANKPTGVDVGYAYFCTDKQTIEGSTNGIMIYHKGNNVWVDALGRVVS